MFDDSAPFDDPRLHAEIGRYIDGYNAAPQAELLGLSPNQVRSLTRGDWRTVGTVRVDQHLNHEQVRRGWIFPPALALLRLVAEQGVAPITPAGNLNRKFVALALEEIGLPPEHLAQIRAVNKVIDEPDSWLLMRLREALLDAGWLRRRKGFIVSSSGRAALAAAESDPGPLFARLFLARMGLGKFLDEEGTPFETPLGPALYLLRREGRQWIDQLTLDRRHMLPTFFPELIPEQLGMMAYQWVVAPCLDFGLLEEENPFKYTFPNRLRTTPLFSEFISFHFPNEGEPMWQRARMN
ncbi:MAG: hypothetical protein ACYC2K_12940 [Gemmatimonadales bacterium]